MSGQSVSAVRSHPARILNLLWSLLWVSVVSAQPFDVVVLPDDAATRGFDLQVGDQLTELPAGVADVWTFRRAERAASIAGSQTWWRLRDSQKQRISGLLGRSGEWLALPATSNAPNPATDAGAALRLALLAAQAGQSEQAMRHFEWLRSQHPEQELEITLSLMQWLPAQADQATERARADALLQQAATAQPSTDDATALALLALLRAESALRSRDCAPVPGLVDRVIAWSKETVLHAQALLVSAQCQLRTRDFAAAKDTLDQAEQILQQKAPGSVELAVLQGRRAVWLQMQRQVEPARAAYQAAITTLAKLSPTHIELGRWHFNLHLLALEHRQLAEAEREARAALAIFARRQPNGLLYYQALAGLAEVLSRRAEFQQAVQLLTEAVQASDQAAPWTYEALSLHVQLANALHQAGAKSAAKAELDALIERLQQEQAALVRQNTLLFADAHQYRATFRARADDCQAALADLDVALSAYRARQQQGAGVLSALLVQAECQLRRAEIDAAAASLRSAEQTAELMSVQGLQRANLLQQQAALAERQGAPARAAELDDQAMAAFEAHRASVGGTPLLRAEWAMQYQSLYKDAMVRAANHGELARLSLLDRRYRFQALLSLLDLPDVDAPAQWLEFLQRDDQPTIALQPGQAMLRWLQLPDELLVLVDRPAQATVLHRLPIKAADLAAMVDRYLLLSSRAVNDARGLAAQFDLSADLYQKLLRPLADTLAGSRHWILIGDGPLQSLPWAALVTERDPEPKFLIESVLLSTAASSDVWLRLQTRSVSTAPALAMGDPVQQAAASSTAQDSERGALQALPGARVEAEQVAARYGARGQLLLGEQVTETAARAALHNVAVAHFALHAVLNRNTPMASYIALAPAAAPAPTAAADGRLAAEEVLQELRLQASLVVLSACASGSGRDLAGQGVLGLGSAFQAAGANAVVASLWPISDAATAILMPDLHQSYADHGNSARALAEAQRRWLAAARDQSTWTRLSRFLGWQNALPEQPLQAYYWAAFTVSGGP